MIYGGKRNKVYEKISELKEILLKHWLSVSLILSVSVLLIVISVYNKKGVNFFRLDQYAETICTTTAGVVGTMFGLTAASYAFRCGDLRNESQEKPHLQKILTKYMEGLWLYFIYSLISTTITILSSLMILFLMQQFTSPVSYRIYGNLGNSVMEYFTFPEKWICCGIAFNFIVALTSIIIMVFMNRSIFKREEKHVKIAIDILNKIHDTYDFEVDVSFKDTLFEEYEKIHNLEIIIKRILKNHESMGEAFSEEQRREKLLTVLINQNLNSEFGLEENKMPGEIGGQYWNNLSEKKRKERWEKCFFIAKRDYENILANRINENIHRIEKFKPVECNFIKVYDDLLTYRDSKLVIGKSNKYDGFDGRALRYTIKKRLLLFYLRGEEFSNMDLSRISFSGADLRYTNFSGSNLTGVRLKGANCQSADFSRVKMAGMYFWENKVEQMGEIPVTCVDDNGENWDIYKGREITNFEEATFTDADVSRAYLDASKAERFSLIGTNFDRAKMFSSLFNNINFTNASLEQAQMYNSAFIDILAQGSNFSKSVMTRSCVVRCDFCNANFEETSLVEAILMDSLFVGAKLTSANFSYSNILACDFEGASCQNVSFKNIVQESSVINSGNIKALKEEEVKNEKRISFRFATLTRTDFSGADLTKIDFENAIGSECIFTMAKGKMMIFNNAMLINSVFNTVSFQNCSFRNTIMSNSIIISSSFINCMFEGTDFSDVLFDMKNEHCFMGGAFVDVDFSNCRGIQSKNFRNCVLMNVDFSGTGLKIVDFSDDVRMKNCIFS